ncbi:nitroreductase family protein [Halalkalibacter hemicellulosilyticus]|uniref:Putative NAD(P)H nitroreductase n=1 Tax=Halalkalibacter hemicellulosilyticusJCM 9152 TaxID=1236971 RepID=W4QA34_9BACI|nr:nitroreductase [Halalkalibacter hemicellulosilyticus]GAE28870.1 nitroreductase [Halalkalibacter hemicellulosilyticusJCM 9152]
MDLKKAIETRRSIGIVKQDPVPQKLIEEALDAATYAPNHYRTEPWRFFVLEGDARKRFGDVLAKIAQSEMKEPLSATDQLKLEREKEKPLRAPIIIAVAVEPSDKKNVIVQEEYAAVDAAVQNMLLTLHSAGLGAVWRTGPVCYHDKVKSFFRLSEKGDMIGFIYVGYPAMEPKEKPKCDYKKYTEWLS